MRVGSFWCHTFLLDLIRPNGTILDFGANYGGFSEMAAALCARVIGFEPNPYWQKNMVSLPKNVIVVRKAIAAKRGTCSFYLEDKGGTNSSLHKRNEEQKQTVNVETITLEDAIALQPAERVELIKIDIEGEELALLQTASAEALQRAAQITVEFEDYHGVAAIRSAIRRMKSLGFWTVRFSWRNYGDVLFVNKMMEPLGIIQRANVILVHKYGRGILRMMNRFIFDQQRRIDVSTDGASAATRNPSNRPCTI
jgi:FkbM family methyltransferase